MNNGVGPRREARNRAGTTLSRVRDHNERAILTLLRERGGVAGAEIARALGVSAQTASVILRALEEQRLVIRDAPVKGKVGKPQIPFRLNPDGAFSLGLRIGRRSGDLLLIDLVGAVRAETSLPYPYPTPGGVEDFVAEAAPGLYEAAGVQAAEVEGLGIAAPFELWNWLDALGAPKAEAERWRDYDIAAGLGRVSGQDVHLANDVNMACNAESLFGTGQALKDFAYFYIGSFVGGGLVLNGQVFHGGRGNAGAFGSIPVAGSGMSARQLIHSASLYTLEHRIAGHLEKPVNLRAEPHLFETQDRLSKAWQLEAAKALAQAVSAVVAVLDIEDIVLDGAFPAPVRDALIADLRAALDNVDQQGLNAFRLTPGQLGHRAGARGAAYEPLMRSYFLEGRPLR